MNKKQRKLVAETFGSKTGKLKKKHIARAKAFVRGTEDLSKLTAVEIYKILGVDDV